MSGPVLRDGEEVIEIKRSAKLPAIPPGSTVLAFGDSVTYGTGAAPGEDWPSRLAAMTRWSGRS